MISHNKCMKSIRVHKVVRSEGEGKKEVAKFVHYYEMNVQCVMCIVHI